MGLVLLPGRPPELDERPEPRLYLKALSAFSSSAPDKHNFQELNELVARCQERAEQFLQEPTHEALDALTGSLPAVRDSLRDWAQIIEDAVRRGDLAYDNLNKGQNGNAYPVDIFMRKAALFQLSLWRLGCELNVKPDDIEIEVASHGSAQVFQEVFQLLRLLDSVSKIPRILEQLGDSKTH